MAAVIVNTAAVLIGSLLGIFFRNHLQERLQQALISALALCTFVIGMQSALGMVDILCVIVCMAVGTAIGEWLRIERRIDSLGDLLRRRIVRSERNSGRFTEGFITASLLFCIGSMTITGCLEAGVHGNNSILYAKSALDFVSSMALSAAMGFGVMVSAFFVLLFQGALTLLARWIGPALSTVVVTEMSAVGGTILIGMAITMLGLGKERLRISNMLPAAFLPILYIPLENWLRSII